MGVPEHSIYNDRLGAHLVVWRGPSLKPSRPMPWESRSCRRKAGGSEEYFEIFEDGFTRDVGGLFRGITLGIQGKHGDSLGEIGSVIQKKSCDSFLTDFCAQ